MSFDLLRATTSGSASNLCNMQSIISSLQQQYSAAATAVSQAMLLQAMSRSGAAAASEINLQQDTTGGQRSRLNAQAPRTRDVPPQEATLGQHAPLDLSVKIQPSRSRSSCASRQCKQQLPLNLARASPDLNNNNNNNNHQQQNSKLITSSTSPSSGSSLSSNEKTPLNSLRTTISISPASSLDDNNNVPANTNTANQDVISSTNGRQRRHMKKQKGVKAHLCNFCGRSFSRSDMLSRHSRLHSGLKPYQCGKCLQVFSRSDHLSTHERTHTGEKPYQCNYCAYSACRRDMITRHMRTHTTGRNSGQRSRLRTRGRRRKKTSLESEGSSDNKLNPMDAMMGRRDDQVFID